MKLMRIGRGVLTRLVRWATAWAWQKEIGVCEGLAVVQGLNMEPGAMEVKIKQDPALAQWVAKCFAYMVMDSPNYTEMQFELCGEYAGKYEWLTVLIQKHQGKTPHQMRHQVERERDELLRQLQKLKS